jgi:hypothetical protein
MQVNQEDLTVVTDFQNAVENDKERSHCESTRRRPAENRPWAHLRFGPW